MGPETKLKTEVMRKLKGLGGHWTKFSPGPGSPAGISDIIGCYKGRYVAIELKAPGKYKELDKGLSTPQQRFLRLVREAGGIAIMADSWDLVIAVLQYIK